MHICSGDHLDKIVKYAACSSKPWLLLLPNFVVGRPSYAVSTLNLHPPPFYVVPAVRYAYIVPSWVVAKATAPFPSFWYGHCAGPMPPPLVAAAAASSKLNVRSWRASHDAQPLVIADIKASFVFSCVFAFCLPHFIAGIAARCQGCHRSLEEAAKPSCQKANEQLWQCRKRSG